MYLRIANENNLLARASICLVGEKSDGRLRALRRATCVVGERGGVVNRIRGYSLLACILNLGDQGADDTRARSFGRRSGSDDMNGRAWAGWCSSWYSSNCEK